MFRTKGKKIDINCDKIIFNENEIGTPTNPDPLTQIDRIYTDPDNRHFKLLGVYFDEYLSFNKHADYTCAKLSRAIFCIKRSANKLSLKSLKSIKSLFCTCSPPPFILYQYLGMYIIKKYFKN